LIVAAGCTMPRVAIGIPQPEGDIVLKRLATAGVLTMAVGGVLLNAAPAMADDRDSSRHHFSKHTRHDHATFDFDEATRQAFTDNDTFAVLNCVQILNTTVIGSERQNCFIGNVENN
jgi:hypothetical protein